MWTKLTSRADHVCLSVRIIQLKNYWTDFDESWYRRYNIGVCPKIGLFDFLKSVISTWRTNEFMRWHRHYRHLQKGHTMA
jgi:hypothetical protein